MRLVWLSVNSSYSHASLALPMLQLAAKHLSNWHWEYLESTVAEQTGVLATRLFEMRPDLVCASLYLFNTAEVFSILERFKTLSPSCPVIVGGPECLGSAAEEVLRRSAAVDCAVRGEGEECLPKIMQSVEAGRFPELFPGTACRFSAHEIRSCETSSNLQYSAWEESPAPASSPFFNLCKPFVQMETTRGCPHGCLYCTSCRSPVRSKSLEKVREELRLLEQKGVREIRLLDRTFNLPEARAVALLRLFRQEFPSLRFHLEIHPQYLAAELREELRLAQPGQLHLEAGIQSLENAVLQAIGRNSSAEQSLAGLKFLCSLDTFDTHSDLLAGLPRQTFSSMLADVETLVAAGPAEIQLEILKVLPGTPLREQSDELKILFNPNPPYEVLQTPDFSASELSKAAVLSRMLDLFYNQTALRDTFRKMSQNKHDFLTYFLEFLCKNGFSAQWSGSLKKRFLLFADYIVASLQDCSASLAFHWIKAGLPIDETPFYKPAQIDTPPENSNLLEGDITVLAHKNTRLWQLETEQATFIFAFNRALSMQIPYAIWKKQTTDK